MISGLKSLNTTVLLGVAAFFAGIGILLLVNSFAATEDSKIFEAESGTTSLNLLAQSEAGTSGGEYIRLGNESNPDSTGKQFFLHQMLPPNLEYLVANPAKYDDLPFDGTTYILEGYSTSIMRSTPVDGEALKQYMSQIKSVSFQESRHNWPLVYATPAGSFSEFDVVAENFGKLAAAIAAAGTNIEGIFFDNEEYFGDSWRNCGGLSDSACRQAAHAAGKKIMGAIIANWPTAQVLTLHGPGISATESSAWYNQYFPYNDIAVHNKFHGNFIAGMVEATVGTQARYIDGGEIYQAQTIEHFQAVKQWVKNGLANVPYIVPPSLAAVWPQQVKASFGTYDWPDGFRAQHFSYRPTQSAAMVQSENTNALDVTDKYVWYYDEQHNFAGNPRSSGKPELKTAKPDWYAALEAAYASR